MQSLREETYQGGQCGWRRKSKKRGEMRSGGLWAFLRRQDEEELARRQEGKCDWRGERWGTQEIPTVGLVLGVDDSMPNLSLLQPPLDGRSMRSGSLSAFLAPASPRLAQLWAHSRGWVTGT